MTAMPKTIALVLAAAALTLASAARAVAEDDGAAASLHFPQARLAQAGRRGGHWSSADRGGYAPRLARADSARRRQAPPEGAPAKAPEPNPFELGYREVSDFFNIREANANVDAGEWELEFEFGWTTDSAPGDDDILLTPNIKYGITDDLFVELEVLPLNIGDGGDQGNGDLSLQVFYQWLRETDELPAFATWIEARFPSGEGSSGVDGELHFNLTKTFLPAFRGHLEGFIETANGGRGDEDIDRRPFQWGVGPGFDYQFDPQTIGVVNYLLRSSEELGEPDQNILEFGMARELVPGQHLKLALDIGLDGHETTPNFEAKVLWSIEWK